MLFSPARDVGNVLMLKAFVVPFFSFRRLSRAGGNCLRFGSATRAGVL